MGRSFWVCGLLACLTLALMGGSANVAQVESTVPEASGASGVIRVSLGTSSRTLTNSSAAALADTYEVFAYSPAGKVS